MQVSERVNDKAGTDIRLDVYKRQDPDDAAAVLNSIDVEHSLFVLVSKSGTTLETLTNESFVKDRCV